MTSKKTRRMSYADFNATMEGGAGLIDLESAEFASPSISSLEDKAERATPSVLAPDRSTNSTSGVSEQIPSRPSLTGQLSLSSIRTSRMLPLFPKLPDDSKAIVVLRITMVLLWFVAGIAVSMSVKRYTDDTQTREFEYHYKSHATKLIQTFEAAIDEKLGAIHTMATALTTFARYSNASFPFCTLPDFVVTASNTRILADALTLRWLPLVTDEQRPAWEEYALQHRFQIDEAFVQDEYFRHREDVELGYIDQEDRHMLEQYQEYNDHPRYLEDENATTPEIEVVANMFQDGTRYHPRIFDFEKRQIKEEGSGPFLPHWQRSPVNAAKQFTLNVDFASSRGMKGIFPYLLQNNNSRGVLLHHAFTPDPEIGVLQNRNIFASQYRHNADPYANDPETKLAYPVHDGFEENAKFVGVLSSTLYWRLYFTDILPPDAQGIICVIENTFNQSFSYRIDGPNVTYLGLDPYSNPNNTLPELFPNMLVTHAIHPTARPILETRSYTQLPLDTSFSKYTLKVYPTQDTADFYISSSEPRVYTAVVASIFVVAVLIFILYDFFVRRRQRNMSFQAIEQARRAAEAERELNEYIAHEVRNPLSAALSACSFVRTALLEQTLERTSQGPRKLLSDDDEAFQTLTEDVSIIHSALRFINELLRSMLDLNRAGDRQLVVEKKTTDVAHDILQPVASMLSRRDDKIEIEWECDKDLLVSTDALRLKQIVFNLGRNASKFTRNGFVRLRADTVENSKDRGQRTVQLYVEDSGPGIATCQRDKMFSRFHESLDFLSQGTGIGLCLCKQLIELMEGDIWLDDDYNSGISNFPGTRFVIDLRQAPLPSEEAEKETLSSETKQVKCNVEVAKKESAVVKDNAKEERESAPLAEDVCTDQGRELPEELSVLFVDDDTILRKLFSRSIKRVLPKWRVQEAANGETAIELTDKEKFDLIFIDQYMSSTEKQLLGTETTLELRAKGITSRICGLSANDVETAFLSSGADAFMHKPISCDKEQLKQELHTILYG